MTIHAINGAIITPSNSGGTTGSDDAYSSTPTPGMNTLPSARTNRIVGMLEEIEEPIAEHMRRSISARAVGVPQSQILTSPNKRHQHGLHQSTNARANTSTRSPLARSRSFRGPISSASSNPPPYANTNSQRTSKNDVSGAHTVSHSQLHLNQTFLTDCSFGIAHDKLIQHLTDVSPFEPYWHTLRALDLSGRKIDSVARLKELMPKLDRIELYVLWSTTFVEVSRC